MIPCAELGGRSRVTFVSVLPLVVGVEEGLTQVCRTSFRQHRRYIQPYQSPTGLPRTYWLVRNGCCSILRNFAA